MQVKHVLHFCNFSDASNLPLDSLQDVHCMAFSRIGWWTIEGGHLLGSKNLLHPPNLCFVSALLASQGSSMVWGTMEAEGPPLL